MLIGTRFVFLHFLKHLSRSFIFFFYSEVSQGLGLPFTLFSIIGASLLKKYLIALHRSDVKSYLHFRIYQLSLYLNFEYLYINFLDRIYYSPYK